jgi:LPS export ABC transporter protein LptC/lipopolysaccharide transport protein LptA
MATEYKKPVKLKIFLLVTICMTLGGVIWIYVDSQQDSTVTEPAQESSEPDATLSIDKIHHTATRKGKKEWSLEAASAHYIGKAGQMVIDDLMVTFFLDDASEVTLTADRGILNTDSNDIEVTGNVVVTNGEYRLLTKKLNYAHEKRVLYSTAPVTISGPEAQLAADKLSFDLNTKKVTLEGSVETTLPNHENSRIRIAADKLVAEVDAGEIEFVGNVKATRMDAVITSDRLEIIYAPDTIKNKTGGGIKNVSIKKIIAEGHVKIITDDIIAETDRAEYTIKSEILVLLGEQSRLRQAGQSITGTKFTLHRNQGKLTVESSGEKRIKATFQP